MNPSAPHRSRGATLAAGRCSRSTSGPDGRPGVFGPTQGSFLVWKYLFREGVGAHQRCLDIGCGTGLAVRAAGAKRAAHVHAIDIDETAVSNTLTTPFRTGWPIASAPPPSTVPWVPEERYDVIVASLYQMPVDPSSRCRPTGRWTTGAAI